MPTQEERELAITDPRKSIDSGRASTFAVSLWRYYSSKGKLTDNQIDAILRGIKAREAKVTQLELPAMPKVQDGRYAVRTGEDILFYRVRTGNPDSSWAGFTFLDRESGGNRIPIKDRRQKADILVQIAGDPIGAALLYGRAIGRCGFCGIRLTDELSRITGVGPECCKKHGIDRNAIRESLEFNDDWAQWKELHAQREAQAEREAMETDPW
jgi:hypothetical protein